ncbi:MAG: hypothetical protein AB7F28_04510 [Candidatus Margulisiibacteriota bacterium]
MLWFKQLALSSFGLLPVRREAGQLAAILKAHGRLDLFQAVLDKRTFHDLHAFLLDQLTQIPKPETPSSFWAGIEADDEPKSIEYLGQVDVHMMLAIDVLTWFLNKTLKPDSLQSVLSLTLPDAVEEGAAAVAGVARAERTPRMPRNLDAIQFTLATRGVSGDVYATCFRANQQAVARYVEYGLGRDFSAESAHFEAEIHRLWEGLLSHMDNYAENRLSGLKFCVGDNPILFVDFLLTFIQVCRKASGTNRRSIVGISPDDIWHQVLIGHRSEQAILRHLAVFLIHEPSRSVQDSGHFLKRLVDHALNAFEGLSSEMCACSVAQLSSHERQATLTFGRFSSPKNRLQVGQFFEGFERDCPVLFRQRVAELERTLQNMQARVMARYEDLCRKLSKDETDTHLPGSHYSALFEKLQQFEGEFLTFRQGLIPDGLNSLEAFEALFEDLNSRFDLLSGLGNKLASTAPMKDLGSPVEQDRYFEDLSNQLATFDKNLISVSYQAFLRQLKALMKSVGIPEHRTIKIDCLISSTKMSHETDRLRLGYVCYVAEGLRCCLAGQENLRTFLSSLVEDNPSVQPKDFSQPTDLYSVAQVAHLVGKADGCIRQLFEDVRDRIDSCKRHNQRLSMPRSAAAAAAATSAASRVAHATDLYFELKALDRLERALDKPLLEILQESMPEVVLAASSGTSPRASARVAEAAANAQALLSPRDGLRVGLSPQRVSREEVCRVATSKRAEQYIFCAFVCFLGVKEQVGFSHVQLRDKRLTDGVFNLMANGLDAFLGWAESYESGASSSSTTPRELTPFALGPRATAAIEAAQKRALQPSPLAAATGTVSVDGDATTPPSSPVLGDWRVARTAEDSAAAEKRQLREQLEALRESARFVAGPSSPYASRRLSSGFASPSDGTPDRGTPRSLGSVFESPASAASEDGCKSSGLVRRPSLVYQSFHALQLRRAEAQATRGSKEVSAARDRRAADGTQDPTRYSLEPLDGSSDERIKSLQAAAEARRLTDESRLSIDSDEGEWTAPASPGITFRRRSVSDGDPRRSAGTSPRGSESSARVRSLSREEMIRIVRDSVARHRQEQPADSARSAVDSLRGEPREAVVMEMAERYLSASLAGRELPQTYENLYYTHAAARVLTEDRRRIRSSDPEQTRSSGASSARPSSSQSAAAATRGVAMAAAARHHIGHRLAPPPAVRERDGWNSSTRLGSQMAQKLDRLHVRRNGVDSPPSDSRPGGRSKR